MVLYYICKAERRLKMYKILSNLSVFNFCYSTYYITKYQQVTRFNESKTLYFKQGSDIYPIYTRYTHYYNGYCA